MVQSYLKHGPTQVLQTLRTAMGPLCLWILGFWISVQFLFQLLL